MVPKRVPIEPGITFDPCEFIPKKLAKFDDMAEIIEKGSKAGSMKANPIALTMEEQREILGRAL